MKTAELRERRIKSVKDRVVIAVIILLSILTLVGMFTWAFMSYTKDIIVDEQKPTFVGEYSTDGENWKEFNQNVTVNEKEKYLYLKGKFQQKFPQDQYLIMPVINLWMNFKIDGKELVDNSKNNNIAKTNTPGYSIQFVPTAIIHNDSVIEIKLQNPYSELLNLTSYRDFLNNIIVGEEDATHHNMLQSETFNTFLGISIFFLGLFGFGFSGIVFTQNRKLYLCYGLVAMVFGFYIVIDAVGMYLPHWIDNPLMCMLLDEVGVYLLILSVSVYMRATMERVITKVFMNTAVILSAVSIFLAAGFQIFGVQDILESEVLLYPSIIIVNFGGLVSLIFESVKYKNQNAIIVLLSIAPVIIGVILEYLNGIYDFLPYRMIIRTSMVLSMFIQFVLLILATKKHYKDMLKYQTMQKELLEARVSIMVSQIQPHFLYNSLTSIAMLCTKDPPLAKTATINFADYLRGNMNSLKEKTPIPFERELEHLEKYLMLEKMRFRELLNIEYDIEVTDFNIPSLTVQPLVENAVKHGVGMKDDGGTVTISTRETDDSYLVIVSDDGVGFDVNEKKNDGRQHVGMENCKHRLKTMCNATVEITSEIGKGTVSKIIIPKEKK